MIHKLFVHSGVEVGWRRNGKRGNQGYARSTLLVSGNITHVKKKDARNTGRGNY